MTTMTIDEIWPNQILVCCGCGGEIPSGSETWTKEYKVACRRCAARMKAEGRIPNPEDRAASR